MLPKLLIVTQAVNPSFVLNFRILAIFPFKVDPLHWESQSKAKNIPEFPSQNLKQIGHVVPELWLDMQTNRDYYFRYKDTDRD